MKQLTVLSIAYPFAPVRPDTAGGAEQVLLALDAALVQAGHQSIVVACEGSLVSGTLISIPHREGMLDGKEREGAYPLVQESIRRAFARYPVDLVHMHGIDFDRYLPSDNIPVLSTLHLPLAWYSPGAFITTRSGRYFNCVSADQQRKAPQSADFLPYIENGVPVDMLHMEAERLSFALLLGRICPEKGFHLALDAAACARIGCIIAGEVFRYQTHMHYYEEEILPRLDGATKLFIGAVDFAQKRKLLNRAKCLLVPSLVDETSSLVAMEALACGTPVIAFRAGALADIVEHGVTGFLVDSVDEMSRAIKLVHTINSDICRARARERFSADTMIQGYFNVYKLLLNNTCKQNSYEDGTNIQYPGTAYA